MSDDEEIIYKGKSLGLYNYLTELGYADFETFEPEKFTKEESFKLRNAYPIDQYKERVKNAVSRCRPRSYTLNVTDHDYRKLVAILSSQLLFKEDAHLVESLLPNKRLFKQRPSFVFHTGIVLTGLLSSVLMLRGKVSLGLVHYVVPACFTAFFSCYSVWQFYREFDEDRKNYILMTHIDDLKKLTLNILKLARFIKETEILSTGQVPIKDIGSVLYVPSSRCTLTDVDVSPQWKTLPHLRKCLSDTLEEVLNVLTASVCSLRQSSFERGLVVNDLRNINGDCLKPCQLSENIFCSELTLLNLKELTSKFLSVQSEYLKELAIIFSSSFFTDTVSDKPILKLSQDKVFEMFMNLHQTLSDISFKLMMQYNIHNIESSTFKKVSHKSSTNSRVGEITELQNSVHSVFLLIYSALLRVRNLEDTLENSSEISETVNMQDKLSLDVTKQLAVLKDDLISTVQCYDLLCQQATGKSKIKVETTEQDSENGSKCNLTEVNIQETGIVVGTSDFTVNSPDEVFLSLSGVNSHEETPIVECVEDQCLERQPQIPKSLLKELSQTLKSRKTDFIQREKHALKRKGLQDIDNSSPPSEEDSEESDDSFSRKEDRAISINYKRHVAAHEYSHSSDSDDEMDPFESGAFLTKLKISKKYQSEPYSDSDSSVLDVGVLNNKTISVSEVASKPSLSTSFLANQAALKSQMWGKNKEEYFSDGSDS